MSQVNETRQHTLFQRVKRLASHAAVKMTMNRDFGSGGGEVGRSLFSWGQKPAPGPLLAPRNSKGIKVRWSACFSASLYTHLNLSIPTLME